MNSNTRDLLVVALFVFLLGGSVGNAFAKDDPIVKVVESNPADSPSTVYVLQSFYDDLTFVDGVFSSEAEAEKWIEDTHGSFERSGQEGVNTYEAGEFTYLITAYEVDHG